MLSKPKQLMLLAIPEEWIAPYTFLITQSVKHPEIASFPPLLLAAAQGDQDAISKVFQFCVVVHRTAQRTLGPGASVERDCCNAIIWLSNQLAHKLEREKREQEDATVLEMIQEARNDQRTKDTEKVQHTEPAKSEPVAVKQKKQDKTSKPGQMILAVQE